MNDKTYATITLKMWVSPAELAAARTNTLRHLLVVNGHLEDLIHNSTAQAEDCTKLGDAEMVEFYEVLADAAMRVLEDVDCEYDMAAECAEAELADEEASR